jgi:hypothetical protein
MRVFLPLTLLFFLLASGCASERGHGPSDKSITQGFSCFMENSYDASPRMYLCAFELDAPSRFFSESSRNDEIARFVKIVGGACNVQRTWEMTDPATKIDHAMSFLVYRLTCK